ncbi:MAG TPA: TonB-dependent receptor, partial [Cytophagales bacterium]
MKFVLSLGLLICCISAGFAQSRYTVSGYVREAGSRELLIGVTVYLPGAATGTTTNTYGFYSLTLPAADSVQVVFSFVGYGPQTRTVPLRKNVELNVELAAGQLLGEVVVEGSREKVSQTPQMSTLEVPIKQIKIIPALLGEKDVLKVLQLMPGVQKGSEGSSGLYVRGGGPDQNLIILDDAVVYNAYHLFGFFSLFNGDALKSVELTKGGFPARYGGRLSSVLEMNMKEGSKEKLHGEGGIGLISSRLTLEGPLQKGKSSFILSGRRTYIDALVRPFIPDGDGGYYFYDLTAKVNYDFGRKDKLYLSGYFGQDRFFVREKYDGNRSKLGFNWGNATGTLRWNHLFNQKLFTNTSLVFSNYRFQIYQD